MRLLNTDTLILREFFGENIPPYAILSHRWEQEEVTFRDLNDGNGLELAGYWKILGLCAQARKDSLSWAWIDTCCIDKSSSAELTEAINSMFNWYRNADVCYAYLSDVPDGMGEVHKTEGNHSFNFSQWFKRGWTLQELLAPKTIRFYNVTWKLLGTRVSLRPILSKVTGVENFKRFKNASIAQKMSWMANRQTTRIEDTAYCMMGLFGVYMPLIYGEGARAFHRLQLELLKISDDDSLLAWSFNNKNEIPATTGPFAASPAYFRSSGNIEQYSYRSHRRPLSMTPKGLLFEQSLILEKGDSSNKISVILNCRRPGGKRPIAIILVRDREGDFDEYERIPDVGGCTEEFNWPYSHWKESQSTIGIVFGIIWDSISVKYQTKRWTFYLRER